MTHAVRVLVVASHPVQYASPLYELYAADPRIDLTVAYCSLEGAHPFVDPDFGVKISWDVPLLDGYRWIVAMNRSPAPRLDGFFGLVNPGLWRIVRRGGFDVVVCPGYSYLSSWIAGLSAKLSGAALVWTTDAQTIRPRSGSRAKRLAKPIIVPRIYGFADGVFVASSRSRHFVSSLGIDPSQIHLTHCVVNNDLFSSGGTRTDRDRVRRGWGVPDDGVIALFSGKLVPRKRPPDLIDAIARVEGVWGVFVGEGKLRGQLEAHARHLGVEARVRFHGFANQRELPSLYAAADFLILPSEHEPFGLVVNEAFAAAIPAIVSDACGVVDDLVRQGQTGFTYPVGDVDQLVGHMSKLASDADLRHAMGQQARRLIAEWGLSQNVEGFVNGCTSLAAKRKRRLSK